MKGDDIAERLETLAVRALGVAKALPKTLPGRHVAGQFLRCGTSGGANSEEARGAESKADFIHKLSIILKELRESRYWLRVIARARALSVSHPALPVLRCALPLPFPVFDCMSSHLHCPPPPPRPALMWTPNFGGVRARSTAGSTGAFLVLCRRDGRSAPAVGTGGPLTHGGCVAPGVVGQHVAEPDQRVDLRVAGAFDDLGWAELRAVSDVPIRVHFEERAGPRVFRRGKGLDETGRQSGERIQPRHFHRGLGGRDDRLPEAGGRVQAERAARRDGSVRSSARRPRARRRTEVSNRASSRERRQPPRINRGVVLGPRQLHEQQVAQAIRREEQLEQPGSVERRAADGRRARAAPHVQEDAAPAAGDRGPALEQPVVVDWRQQAVQLVGAAHVLVRAEVPRDVGRLDNLVVVGRRGIVDADRRRRGHLVRQREPRRRVRVVAHHLAQPEDPGRRRPVPLLLHVRRARRRLRQPAPPRQTRVSDLGRPRAERRLPSPDAAREQRQLRRVVAPRRRDDHDEMRRARQRRLGRRVERRQKPGIGIALAAEVAVRVGIGAAVGIRVAVRSRVRLRPGLNLRHPVGIRVVAAGRARIAPRGQRREAPQREPSPGARDGSRGVSHARPSGAPARIGAAGNACKFAVVRGRRSRPVDA
ncbi:MAG: four helix bundle protein [Deltaproteobacteria bacterium]|nr:four helix bundle protein [Deltaproteobacteria bacterium]